MVILNIWKGGSVGPPFFISIYRLVFLLLLVSFQSHSLQAQEPAVRILFYNVENLFDTINDPVTQDGGFTPDGNKYYGSSRYQKKLFNISHAIAYSFDDGLPDVIGLAEVENRRVLEDLVEQRPLRSKKYGIVHYDSPDTRGIDVALLYDPEKIEISTSSPVAVKLPAGSAPTRDILYVNAKVDKDIIHFFVNHWPSRIGGGEATEEKRVAAANTLLREIRSRRLSNNIIVMGDLNDYPQNKSVRLFTDCSDTSEVCFQNTVGHLSEKNLGTHYYNGKWSVIDHILVSSNLISGRGRFYVREKSGKAVTHPWLMYKKDNGEEIPDRTYGKNYFGGFSDHLPVTLIVYKSK